jgi:hypothetical protein
VSSQLQKGDIGWEHLFGDLGVRWFHTGGIFAGLSATAPDMVEEAMACAKKHGTTMARLSEVEKIMAGGGAPGHKSPGRCRFAGRRGSRKALWRIAPLG